MKLAVFGATGATGTHVLAQALAAGHDVTAVIRSGSTLARPPEGTGALEVVTVPGLTGLNGPDGSKALEPALTGRDAVVSMIGPRRRKDAGITAPATAGILAAMAVTGVRRLVVISAAPVGPVPPGESLPFRFVLLPMVARLLKPVYDDLRAMEDLIVDADPEWTVVRPPRLTHGPRTGRYRTAVGANVPRGRTVSRADVADLALAVLTDAATVRRAIGVAY